MTKKPTKSSDDDDFLSAMGGVRPIKGSDRHVEPPKKPKRTDMQPKFREVEPDIPSYYIDRNRMHLRADDPLSFERAHIRPRDIKKLKQGDFRHPARIDLHGLRLEEASDLLHHFIEDCCDNGHRFALIVHGKGHYSDDQVPVLKNMINQWLRQHQNVLAFHTARPKDGGTGAVYVLLKAKG